MKPMFPAILLCGVTLGGEAQNADFIAIVQDGDHAFALYSGTTIDNKVVRNAEYYTFSNGKIKSRECFFGGTGAGYPTNAK